MIRQELDTDRVERYIEAPPEALYDVIADVTRTPELSPELKSCTWVRGATGPAVGARFRAWNRVPGRPAWRNSPVVTVADRGREFAWVVGGSYVRWAFTMAAVDAGTELTETWDFLPDGLAMFAERYGDAAPEQIALRTRQAHEGIPATLAAIKRIAESG